MASSRIKNKWGDIFSTPKQSKHASHPVIDHETSRFTHDDLFVKFAKRTKADGFSNYQENDDFIFVEEKKSNFFAKVFRWIENAINDLRRSVIRNFIHRKRMKRSL